MYSGNYEADVAERRYEAEMEQADQERAMIDEEWDSLQRFGIDFDAVTWITAVGELVDRDPLCGDGEFEELERLEEEAEE
jgi:hypothetical protein